METPDRMDPREVIVPLFEGRQKAENYLGTGSIIGDGTVVLTCEHVIRGCTGQLAFPKLVDGRLRAFGLTVLEADRSRDLALMRIEGYQAPNPLQIAFDVHVAYNSNLLTLEYAQTEKTDTGGFWLNPAVRRGHKTRNVDVERFGAIAGLHALELSFPALEGASGAPVMFEASPFVPHEPAWGIVGVLITNIGYDTVPAQIVTELGADNSYLEERQYILPQGIAVDINHLKPLYERVFGTSPLDEAAHSVA